VGGWTGIIQVAANWYNTYGVKSNGTVVADGNNTWGQCNVGSWTNIIQVAAGEGHTVGLRSDGTVVATGTNFWGELGVAGWTNIVQIAAGQHFTIGLRADGTVLAVGSNSAGQCNVGSWTDIIQVSGGYSYTIGLKADGTVVTVGLNNFGQCNVGSWTGITQVAAGAYHTVGVTLDGRVVGTGSNSSSQLNFEHWLLQPFVIALIDIKPGSNPNSVNLGSNGNVPVAILSSPVFDATTVDPLSVTLAGASARVKGKGSSSFVEDVNGDGFLDLVVHIDTQALQLCGTDTYAVLKGNTFGGAEVAGKDMVRIVRE
jgi:alpha-tubulin suppressor-like RCC1 family protein